MCNNQIVFTDDGFKTSKSVLGEFTIDGEAYWGLLAQAVIAGYVEGSQIRGGTIQIGEQSDGSYAFEVREDGSVVMNGGSQIAGYAKEENETIVSDTTPAAARDGQLWINTSTTPYTIMTCESNKSFNVDITSAPNDVDIIYITDPASELATSFTSIIGESNSASFNPDGGLLQINTNDTLGAGAFAGNDVATIFIGSNVTYLSDGCFAGCPNLKTIYVNDGRWVPQQGNVYTSRPEEYYPGDLWILADGETEGVYQPGSILKADKDLKWVDAVSNITSTLSNVNQYFEFNSDNGLKIGQKDKKFHVNINSTKMGFYDGDTEVVHISNQSANIDNLTVEGKDFLVASNATFNRQMSVCKVDLNEESNEYTISDGFSWKIEDNGSFSLVKN